MKAKQFIYGDYRYDYILLKLPRKSLSLTVYPDKRIVLKCPPQASSERVEQFLKKKWLWLRRQLRYFDRFELQTTTKEYVAGESFRYLGRQYKLVVRSAKSESVHLERGRLVLKTSKATRNASHNKKLLERWFRERAEKVLTQQFHKVSVQFKQGAAQRFRICKMKTRWGSCSKRGTISLNENLIQAPRYAIDYVIMHELCHLVVHNHSAKFYRLLDSVMVDWKARQHRLQRISV